MANEKFDLEENDRENVKTATVIGAITIVLNILLGISKMVIGKMTGFEAVFSDGVHGTGDILTTLIAVISVWISARKRNDKYNYGHERWSSICCIVLSVLLFVLSVEIVQESTENLIQRLSPDYVAAEDSIAFSQLWWISMSLSIASVVVKGLMFFVTLYGAKKARSKAMVADAWHQWVDALSSVAAIFSLLGYLWLDNNILDPIFSYPIAVMVLVIGIETFHDAANELTDHAIDAKKLEEVKSVIYQVVPKEEVKLVRTRIYAEKFYLDIFLLQSPETTLEEVDALSDRLKKALFDRFPDLKNAYVIVEPDNKAHREQEETLR